MLRPGHGLDHGCEGRKRGGRITAIDHAIRIAVLGLAMRGRTTAERQIESNHAFDQVTFDGTPEASVILPDAGASPFEGSPTESRCEPD